MSSDNKSSPNNNITDSSITKTNNNEDAPRLHVYGRVQGYRRRRKITHPNVAIVKIENVNNRNDAMFYVGKHVAYVYRGRNDIYGTKLRVKFGQVVKPHGWRGYVRCKFLKNLPPSSFGKRIRIMLFPSAI